MKPSRTQWNDPEFIEAIRLINKFFPESKGFISNDTGVCIWDFIDSMKLGEFNSDFSCEHFGIPEGPDLGFDKKGGFDGERDLVFIRLIEHTNFNPSGRVVVIPDALGYKGWSIENLKPFTCSFKTVGQRLKEMNCLFEGTCHDSIFVFESGEAIAVDHDNRLYWAKSKINKLFITNSK